MTLRADSRPLYVRAAERLRRYIAENALSDGDRLPPEADLATMFGVSRSTIREGLRELEVDGQVTRVHGRGTTVSAPRLVSGLNRLEPLDAVAAAQGWTLGTVAVEIAERPLTGEAAAALGVAEGEPGVRVARVKTRDGKPICQLVTWLVAADHPADGLRRSSDLSLIRRLAPQIDCSRACVSAAAASAEEASRLDVAPGSALVILFETFLDAARLPISWSRHAVVPDAMILEVVRYPPAAEAAGP